MDDRATEAVPVPGHGRRPGIGVALIGRGEDIALVHQFVDRAASVGGALMLSGEAGVGKTVLLEAAARYAEAHGVRVLRATGAQFEANVSFAGLHQILYPLTGSLSTLNPPQQDALGAALGLAQARHTDRLVVSAAVLTLLTQAAAAEPVLIVVDDLPWLDQVSAAVLGFVARRTAGTRIGLLASTRTGEEGLFDRSGIPGHELGPLSAQASADLLDSRYPSLSPRVAKRLLTEANGNPLALLELPAALNLTPGGGPSGALPDTLPLTQRLQNVFAGRVEKLTADARHSLLLAVLGSGDLRVLDDAETAALAAAERMHLASIDRAAARISFRHPLIRSAVVELSTAGERRDAHRVLAGRCHDDLARYAWHLAEAATGPDERVAALLQEVGHANLFRGDSVGAITELLRAADLSPAGTDRSSRLAEAAYLGAIVTGDLSSVPSLMDAARRADPRYGGSLAGAVAGAYHLLNENGDIDSAHRLLAGAIESLPDPSDARNKTLIEALYTLLMVSFFGGRQELWVSFHTAVGRLRPGPPRLLGVLGRTFTDPARLALPALDDLTAAIAGLRNETSPERIVRTAIAGSYLDRAGDCRDALWRAVRHGREGGAVTSAIEALFLLGNDAYFTGRWDELTSLVEEGLALCDEHGYRLLRWPGVFLQALVTSARGHREIGKTLTDDMARWAAPRGAGAVSAYASHVKMLAALARGDFDDAYHHATSISPAGQLASHAPNALWTIMEMVEAAMRSGRVAEARAHVAAVSQARIAELSPRLAVVVAGATAMAAPDDDHRDRFQAALAMPSAGRWPFDLARIHLAYGERLRRTKSPAAARPHLEAALDSFEQLRAQPWTERASSELRAAGIHRDLAREARPDALTPQQREIAELAAAGLTNKQIGERLFLSARTVGNHLYQIFPKLGVTSRAALRDALHEQDRQQKSTSSIQR